MRDTGKANMIANQKLMKSAGRPSAMPLYCCILSMSIDSRQKQLISIEKLKR